MTGYGVGRVKEEDGECLVEIKSLNNKYCDVNIKNNFQSLEIEQKIEKLIKDGISRGKVNILVKVENYGLTEEKIILNEDVADSCYKNLKALKEKYELKDEIGIDSMLKFKDIFKIVKEEESAKIWLLVEFTKFPKPIFTKLFSIFCPLLFYISGLFPYLFQFTFYQNNQRSYLYIISL